MTRWDEAYEETAGNLLQVIDRLDAGQSLTIKSVAQMCDVDEPCARRYLGFAERHRDLVSGRRPGRKHKEWRKKPSAGAQDGEAVHRTVALEFAAAALAELEGTPHLDAIRDAAERERNRLAPPAADRADRIARTFHPLRPEVSQNPDRTEMLRVLASAIERRHRVWMRYLPLPADGASSSDGPKEYTIEPWSFVLHKGRLLLIAAKIEGARKARRTFNIDAIKELHDTGEKISGAAHRVDHERTFRDSFGIYTDRGKAEQVHLRVRGAHAVALAQRAVHHSQHLRTADGEWTDVHLRLAICPEFKAFVLGLVPDVQVLAPVSLRDELHAAVESWLKTGP